jgi:hypothetical protein
VCDHSQTERPPPPRTDQDVVEAVCLQPGSRVHLGDSHFACSKIHSQGAKPRNVMSDSRTRCGSSASNRLCQRSAEVRREHRRRCNGSLDPTGCSPRRTVGLAGATGPASLPIHANQAAALPGHPGARSSGLRVDYVPGEEPPRPTVGREKHGPAWFRATQNGWSLIPRLRVRRAATCDPGRAAVRGRPKRRPPVRLVADRAVPRCGQ